MSQPLQPAPRRLMRNVVKKRSHARLIVMRCVGMVILIVSAITPHPFALALSIPVLLMMWASSLGLRLLYKRNTANFPELREDTVEVEPPGGWPQVLLVAPARNEEAGIEAAVRSFAALDYSKLGVIVVNDHSTDATPSILDRLAAELPRVRVLHNPERQTGWLGKANAIWRAIEQSTEQDEWLVLTDADIEFHPLMLRRAIAAALEANLDFMTCVPYLECKTLSEELALPVSWRGILVGVLHNKINDPQSLPVGIGAFILIRRSVYIDTGGHSVFYDQQPEDTLLAALVKDAGRKVGMAWTRDLLRVRIYRGYREVRDILVRKHRVNADDDAWHLIAYGTYWYIQFLAPIALFLWDAVRLAQHGFSWLLTIQTLLAFAVYFDTVRDFQTARLTCEMRPFIPWLHPVTGLFRIWLEWIAIFQIVTGKKMSWRGREFENARTPDDTQVKV